MVQVTVGEPLGEGSGNITSTANLEEVHEMANTLPNFLVNVRKGACGVCGDGRGCTHTLAETAPEPGPSVFGGPLITAFGAAELVGDYFGSRSGATTVERQQEVADTLEAGGIALGAHVAEDAVEKTDKTFIDPETGLPQTGCGANDKFVSIMDKPANKKDFINGATQLLLGDKFNANHTKYTDGDKLQNRIKDHNSRDALNEVANRAEGKNVEVLQGKHEEMLVVFNFVRDTTVDRDALVAATGKQVFVVDMWYIDDLAHAMADGRPDGEEMFAKLQHAMVAFQVSTYLTLCDGSHRPVILQNQPQEAAIAGVR